jgi:hypothetical protein
VKLGGGSLVILKLSLPLDLRALRRDIDACFDAAREEQNYLVLDLPPTEMDKCRTLLELIGL